MAIVETPGDASQEAACPPDPSDVRFLSRLTVVLLIVGLIWRIGRYLLREPFWGDEMLLAYNFVDLNYLELTRRLDHCQIAPLLFLWGERTALLLLGTGELSLRLLPFLGGCIGLILAYYLTGLMLQPRARAFALGLLAVSSWPVTMSVLLKPYALDFCLSLALLVPAVAWLREPRLLWLILLTCLVPLALLSSYPVVFVAGGISFVLFLDLRGKGRSTWFWFVAYNLVVLASFGLGYRIGVAHLNTSYAGGGNTGAEMQRYWDNGFPPLDLSFPLWFVRIHLGEIMGYPVGSGFMTGALTFLLCLVGLWAWWKQGERTWLLLVLAPFVLHLFAAAIRRYPYGPAARLTQHLAPLICILAGVGLAWLVETFGRSRQRVFRLTVVLGVLMGIMGVGGLVRDVVKPAGHIHPHWARQIMPLVEAHLAPDDPVVVCGPIMSVGMFGWYWRQFPGEVSWDYTTTSFTKNHPANQLWGFVYGDQVELAIWRLGTELSWRDPAWRLAGRIPFSRPARGKDPPESCTLLRFVRERK